MKAKFGSLVIPLGVFLLSGTLMASLAKEIIVRIGKQDDGRTLVSSGQYIEPETYAFRGRPADIALHPDGQVFAMTIMSQVDDFVKSQVVLANQDGIIKDSSVQLDHHPAFHGMAWSPAGDRLVLSVGETYKDPDTDGLIILKFEDGKLSLDKEINLAKAGEPDRVVPGGLCFNADGSKLYVACVDLNAVLELDGQIFERYRKFPVGMLPYSVKLSSDGRTLITTNWGGRVPKAGEFVSQTGISKILVDKHGAPTSGTVSLIDIGSGNTSELSVGIHPSDISIDGNLAYVANTMSDSISTIDVHGGKVLREDRLRWKGMRLMGSMPTAFANMNGTLYICNGGDNALAEYDLASHEIKGYRPAGFFPVGVVLMGGKAIVANSKGNGSIARTRYGGVGNAHEFEGTVSVLDLNSDLSKATEVVARDNHWGGPDLAQSLKVYNGAIKHVIYIIKENKTYDQIFGDMEEGNGDPKLCILGEKVMPNHRAIAREFTLFDNAYVSGTNSGDGHQWSTQALANDYVEKFYVGYSRTYNDDGNCAMSLSNYGTIWDAASAKGLTVRDYGEFVVADDATFKPRRPKDWFEAWEDRRTAKHEFTFVPHTRVAGLAPFVHPTVHYWPLIQSDQSRADEFIKDLTNRIRTNTVPNLMIMSLPCDHTEGEDPAYPQPQSMMADNDLGLGRVVDAVSHSAIWKDTCIFVIEDDSQSGLDHVDGHRTPYLVISPYTKRHWLDHTFYNTDSMIRSMELMLGFGPMNRFDKMATPIVNCFTDQMDLAPYDVRPNNVVLNLTNPGRNPIAMTADDKYWMKKTMALDWSHPDGPDASTLDQIIWHSLRPTEPFPGKVLALNRVKDDDGD
jgi:DNA-binding beta-propeller fold protein YncE